jgi:uncharacterized ion transporter superfamily protein YfcC
LAQSTESITGGRKGFDWSALSNLNPLTVLFVLIVLTDLLTFLVPGGEFKRKTIEVIGMSKDVIIPGTFHYIAGVPQTFAKIWPIFMQGAVEGADVSFTIFLCAGALTAVIATGAVTSAIGALVAKMKDRSYLLIPALVFAFGLGGATYGMYEDAIPFVLVLAPLMLAMKFDSLVAVMIVQYGVAIGSASGFLNPFAVGIGQAMAQVPMTSGFGVRVVMWIVFMIVTSLFIMRYAFKVAKDPKSSAVYEDDLINREKLDKLEQDPELSRMSGRHILVLLLLAAGFAVMVYGVMKLGWWFNEIGSIFLFMGIIIPLVGGMSINEMISKNMEGMSSVMVAVILISASRIMMLLLDNSKIMDTILFTISNMLRAFPGMITIQIMYAATALIHAIMGSSSGVAATVMPILAPLGDVLNIPRQTVVTAYQLATGTFGYWVPWDGISFAMCSLAGINFFRYIRKTMQFALFCYIPTVVITLALMVAFKFN